MRAGFRPAPGRDRVFVLPRAFLAILLAVSAAPPARAAGWRGSCDSRFRGTSTLHDFAGSARCRPFAVDVESGADGKASIGRTEVVVPVSGMDTGNGSRDRQMRRMFAGDQFPDIRGTFGNIDPEKVRWELRQRPEAGVPLDFTLTIRDIARPVHAVARNFRDGGTTISFVVDYAVSLGDYGLTPPKAFFGLVRVGNEVNVTTAVRLEAAGAK
ncbi:MAG: YceI family protein [Gemmatimonadota bacterium]